MNRKLVTRLAGATLIGITTIASAGAPATTAGAMDDDQGVISQQEARIHTLGHKMMGHISLAQMALDLGLPDEASSQIRHAEKLQQTLVGQMPQFVLNSSFEFGKITYDDKSTLRDHYIPVVDDTFLVSNYEDIYKNAKAADADVLSAGVMHVRVSADLREVRRALEAASAAINSEDYATAASALDNVFKYAIIDEDEITDPELMISENLALTKAFIAHENYDSARLTLEHVQGRLKEIESDKNSTLDKTSVDEFSSEIDQIRADLRMKDPSLLQKVSHRLDSWGDKISGWFG